MSIKIRKATEADSKFLATMILESSRAGKTFGKFDLIFDTNDSAELIDSISKLTTTAVKNHCHYSNFLVAEIDGNLVGTLCSYEPRIATKEASLLALSEIIDDDAIEERLAPLYSCEFDLKKNALMFDFMEEVDGFIDVGILKALMQKSLLTARLKGYTKAQTIVEIGSLETIMFYKTLGFRELESKECELYKETFGRSGLMLLALEF